MSTLQDAIEQIQRIAKSLSGIKAAPDYAPDDQAQYPFAVTYASIGSWGGHGGLGGKRGLHTIVTEIHVSRNPGLARAIEEAMPYCESFVDAIFDDIGNSGKLYEATSGLGHGMGDPVRYTFGALQWAGIQTVGFRFEIDIKQISTVG